MRNCGRRGRSRNLMLAPNLLPKAVPHSGSRLLLGLIVRPDRRLVEGRPPLGHTPPRPSRPPERPGGPDAGDPRPVAALSQRARLLALRVGAPAPLLPEVVLPRPTQPAHSSPGARVAPLAAGFRRGSYGTFGGLPRDGHYPHPGHREGEGFSQGAFRRPSKLRTQRLQDRVGIRLQGGPRGGPRGRDHRFRAGRRGLGREAHRRRPHSFRPPRSVPGRQGLHGARVGAAVDGALRSARCGRPEKRLPQGVVEGRSALGLWQAPDHRRGHRPTQGLLLSGASSCEDVGGAADAPGRQGRGLHLRTTDQRLSRPTAAPPGGSARIAHCTSVVLELRHYEVRLNPKGCYDGPVTELQTPRLLLRPWRAEDLDPYARMCADSDVMRYMPKTMSREESSQQLSQFIRHWQERGFGLWAVEEKGTGAFIGRIGLTVHDDWPERKSGSPTSENSTSTHSGE